MIDAVLDTLTSLGNAVVTLPIAGVILVWLGLWLGRRVALAWLVALIACGAVTAALKIYFHACPIPGAGLTSPSGHTSLSLFVYGGLFLITGARLARWPRLLLGLAGALLVVGIAVSRVLLLAHSRSEVGIGIAIGGAALALFWRSFRRVKSVPMPMPVWPIWLAALVPILLLHTDQLPTESLLTRLALYFRAAVDFCA